MNVVGECILWHGKLFQGCCEMSGQALFPPSRRTHGVYPDGEVAMQRANDLVRLLNGVPMGWVLYTFTKLGATALCSCRAEEMSAWRQP